MPTTFSNFSLTGTEVAPANTAVVTPALKASIPASVVAGQKLKLTASATLTNTSGSSYAGALSTQWFLDPVPFVDPDAFSLGAASSKTVRLKTNAKVSSTLHLTSLPSSVPAGTYYLVARVTDANSHASAVASSTTITVGPATVTLSATLAGINKIASGDVLTLTDTGNVPDISSFTTKVAFSTDAAGQVAAGSSASTSKTLHLNPNKPAKIKIAVSKALLSSLTAGQSYYLVITETDITGHSITAVSPNAFTA